MINLSWQELKIIAKLKKVKNYKSKSKDKLTKILIEKIRKKFNESRDRFSKSKKRSLEEIFMK